MVEALIGITIIIIVGVASLEILIRKLGYISFPLYKRDINSIYTMKPAQCGKFRNKNYWHYDQRGMRMSGKLSSFSDVNLLVGDSVVDGGIHIDQDDTLAYYLAKRLNEVVYPIACPGWSLANSIAALASIPGWDTARRLIWVINVADFGAEPAGLDNENMLTRYPNSAIIWMARKFMKKFVAKKVEVEKIEFAYSQAVVNRLAGISKDFHGEVVLVRYPMAGQKLKDHKYFNNIVSEFENIIDIDISSNSEWSDICYLDAVHPNKFGLGVLSNIIHRGLK